MTANNNYANWSFWTNISTMIISLVLILEIWVIIILLPLLLRLLIIISEASLLILRWLSKSWILLFLCWAFKSNDWWVYLILVSVCTGCFNHTKILLLLMLLLLMLLLWAVAWRQTPTHFLTLPFFFLTKLALLVHMRVFTLYFLLFYWHIMTNW